MGLIVAGTGHRPEDCVSEGHARVVAATVFRYKQVDVFISGMAAGFDLWAADEALEQDIAVIAARPWAGHEPRVGDEELYQKVLDLAQDVYDINDSKGFPGPWCYHDRNHWMVDSADAVMAYLNLEKESGGTYQCVKYAHKKAKPVNNVYYDPPF